MTDDGDDQQQAEIGPVRKPDYLRPVYSNFVVVSHTPWDYHLTFAQVLPPNTPDETSSAQTEGVRPEAVAEVIIPANLMAGFMTALKQNFDRYLENYGVPGMNPEGPEI